MQIRLGIIVMLLALFGCEKPVDTTTSGTYFPPVGSTQWETVTPASLNFNATALSDLQQFLIDKHSKAFLILVDGRIAVEWYMNGHTANTEWEWNSAGKTLVAATTGLAAQEGRLQLSNKASDYLGLGWTAMGLAKENLITVRNLLTMTAGNDDAKQLMTRANITYVADAGSRWAYSNIFQKLTDVVAGATGQSFETYFDSKLKNKIGMDGRWNFGTIFTIYHSTARSMARFGLLALHNGKWNNEEILNPAYFSASTQTSQSINPSYGYLWWLNGKTSYMVPGSQTVFPGTLVPNAPADMFAAMGANDQRLYVIPSKKMIVIRMGDASDPANPNFAVSGFDNALWAKISAAIQ